mmetsp:Transcript_25131/g.45489  ORF Transcript_25131/g.45489 Transcript_25131/m.45489 type:complete len:84 (-) Transcript_25131:316-567(-)
MNFETLHPVQSFVPKMVNTKSSQETHPLEVTVITQSTQSTNSIKKFELDPFTLPIISTPFLAQRRRTDCTHSELPGIAMCFIE